MSDVRRHEDKLAWWKQQAERVQRDRAQLKWVLIVGALLASLALVWRPLVALAIVAVALTTWAMGIYMTYVRRGEFQDNIREAEEALARAQRAESVPPTKQFV